MAPVILLVLLWVAPAETSDRLVSLEVRDAPLSEVLQRLSGQTGYAFILDSSWGDYRVSAVLKEVSLHAGLRQVLGKLSHALIQLRDKRIRLVIMEPAAPGPAGSPGGGAQARGRDRRPPVVAPGSAFPLEPDPAVAAEESVQI